MAKLNQISWWHWIPWRGWRIVKIVEAADEIPEKLPFNAAVIVGSVQNPKWLVFDCPCKTGHRIMITTDPLHYPSWRIIQNKNLTVSPSVDFRTKKMRCHYFIKNGKTVWVKDEGERFE